MASVNTSAYNTRITKTDKASVSKYSHRHPTSIRALRWVLSRSDGKNEFTFFVNPSECQWKIATRTVIEKINGGCVHHEWPQVGIFGSRTRYDQPILSLSFQSGIITPNGYDDILSNETNEDVPFGLGNFYDFLSLLDRPDVQENGETNYIQIQYSSLMFGGQPLWLSGFFTEEGVSWTDSSDTPNMITSWGASFMVYHSQPEISKLQQHFQLLGIPVFI